MKEKAFKNSRNNRKTVILVLSLLLCSVFLVYAFLIVTFFFVIPSFDNDSQKVESYYGYSRPMNIVAQDDNAEYIFAYYTSGSESNRGEAEWTVIDDQEAIRKYKDTFVIYLSEKSFDVGVGRDFFIFKDGKRVYSSNLCYFPYCMIYDDFFALYEKRLTVEQMKQYAIEHELDEKLFY